MGLITGLLMLPLAPVRGTMWLAGVIQAEAEKDEHDETAIVAGLMELDAARGAGTASEEEIEEAENALIERLIGLRSRGEQDIDGSL